MNKVIQSMKIAFRALRVNKLRSALTMLGIIIGVGAVIAMVAVGSGATARIQQQIASIGSNVIIVLSGSINTGGIRMGTGNAQTLTEDDGKAIANECPAVQATAPSSRGGAQVVYGNNNWGTQILMLRLPKALLSRETLAPYCVDEGLHGWTTGDHLIIEWRRDGEPSDEGVEGEGWMARLTPTRRPR